MKKLFISNSFSVSFPFKEKIRREANSFEDKLKRDYPSIQTLPIPDNMDPRMPRIILDSAHGFSQIAISQTSISLNVHHYSEEYQLDISKGKQYLEERVSWIFELLAIAKIKKPHFSGVTTQIHINSSEKEDVLIKRIADCFNIKSNDSNLYEFDIKKVNIIENAFFSNIRVRNFRSWASSESALDQLRLAKKSAVTHGIEIIGDFNDRHKFNEKSTYSTSLKIAKNILDKGLSEIDSFSNRLIKGGKK